MRYQLFEVEVSAPMQDLPVPSSAAGVAIILRRHGVPIDFWMRATSGEMTIAAGEVDRRVGVVEGRGDGRSVVRCQSAGQARSREAVSRPVFTLAICTKDRPEGVARLLESLRAQVARADVLDVQLDILIVDNAPADERTRALAERWPAVRYVREHPPGLNFGRNRALREAHGELLVFLDDDVIVDRYWLEGLVSAWVDNPDAAAFTGQVLPLELETEAQIMFEERGGFRRGFERVCYGSVWPGNPLYPSGAAMFGTGANMAFNTDVLRRLGGFDEALDSGAPVPGGGDLDVFYRVIRGGHSLVYEPRYLVFHQHRREIDALINQYKRSWGLGYMCFMVKSFQTDPARRIALALQIVVWFGMHVIMLGVNLAKRLLGRRSIPPAVFTGEIWYGLKGLFGGYGRSQRHIAALRKKYT